MSIHTSVRASPGAATCWRQAWVRRSALPYRPHFSKIIELGRMRSATLADSVG